MADVATKCISGNDINGGRIVIKMPNMAIQHRQWGYNNQPTDSQLETKYTDRFDDLGYYDNPITP